MPDGPSIFETTGAWEDFATPARDFRLLIAIDVVRGFPDRVARRPERYAMPKGKSVADVKAELQSVLASELAARKFSYTRSDGSQWTLALKDVIDRAADLEMAYNLNDCVELRWGAPDKSEEASTCKRHAPAAQRAKMTEYRAWFHERHWPTPRNLIRAAAAGRAPSSRRSRRGFGRSRPGNCGWRRGCAGRGDRQVSPTSKPRRARSCCISITLGDRERALVARPACMNGPPPRKPVGEMSDGERVSLRRIVFHDDAEIRQQQESRPARAGRQRKLRRDRTGAETACRSAA